MREDSTLRSEEGRDGRARHHRGGGAQTAENYNRSSEGGVRRRGEGAEKVLPRRVVRLTPSDFERRHDYPPFITRSVFLRGRG
jgi:hypothetical protein